MKKQKFDQIPVEEVEAIMDFTVKDRNSIHNMTNLKRVQYDLPIGKVYNEIMNPNPFKKKKVVREQMDPID